MFDLSKYYDKWVKTNCNPLPYLNFDTISPNLK